MFTGFFQYQYILNKHAMLVIIEIALMLNIVILKILKYHTIIVHVF